MRYSAFRVPARVGVRPEEELACARLCAEPRDEPLAEVVSACIYSTATAADVTTATRRSRAIANSRSVSAGLRETRGMDPRRREGAGAEDRIDNDYKGHRVEQGKGLARQPDAREAARWGQYGRAWRKSSPSIQG